MRRVNTHEVAVSASPPEPVGDAAAAVEAFVPVPVIELVEEIFVELPLDS